jgi:DNA-binding transcriptional LysR family regulator
VEIQKLIYFISLANTLNFTKSAEDNHITQAGMSRQISSIESELGVTLFQRNSRKVKLTPEGEEFYLYAQSIINNYNEAIERISNMDSKKVTLRIGLGPYEHALAQPVIEKYTKENPDIRIYCLQYDYTNLVSQFRKGMLDIMFCMNTCAEKIRYAKTIKLFGGDWLTLCSKTSPLLKIQKPTLAEFSNQIFINLEASSEDFQAVETVTLGFKPVYTVRTNTLNAKIALTAAGVGISRVPKFLEDLIPDTVAVLDCTYPSVRWFVCSYLEPKKQDSPVNSFIEIIKELYP